MNGDLRGRFRDEAASGRTWVVFSDVALAMLFVFLIYIFAQFVHYQKIAVLEELERRQAEIEGVLHDSLPQHIDDDGDGRVDEGEVRIIQITECRDVVDFKFGL